LDQFVTFDVSTISKEETMSTSSIIEKTAIPSAGIWQIDTTHSDLRIIARHLMVAKVRGTFGDLAGTIVVAENPLESTVEIEAKAASVTTGTTDRDNHLRSADFLDAERYPSVTFKSTGIAPRRGGWRLSGDLTIRGVTNPVTFDVVFEGETTDPYGNTKAGFSATGEIDRRLWGLTWNAAIEGGGVLVSEKFKIEFDVEAALES
jgi:polyisoprenoid-binding protein YceI